jgi:hypothetical protein
MNSQTKDTASTSHSEFNIKKKQSFINKDIIHIQQQTINDCGKACLQMAFK